MTPWDEEFDLSALKRHCSGSALMWLIQEVSSNLSLSVDTVERLFPAAALDVMFVCVNISIIPNKVNEERQTQEPMTYSVICQFPR